MWLAPFFRKEIAEVALTACLSLKLLLSYSSIKEGTLTSYVQVENHILDIQAPDNITTEVDTKVVRFTQLTDMSPLQYADTFLMKTLCCPQVFDEYILKETFTECAKFSIRCCRRSFWINNKHAALRKLAYDSPSLTKLQEAAREVAKSSSYRSCLTIINGHQVVIRVGDQEKSIQYHPRAVDDKRGRKATLNDKSQLIEHMEDVQALDEQHQDCSQRSLQITRGIVEWFYSCGTKLHNVQCYLPRLGPKS